MFHTPKYRGHFGNHYNMYNVTESEFHPVRHLMNEIYIIYFEFQYLNIFQLQLQGGGFQHGIGLEQTCAI